MLVFGAGWGSHAPSATLKQLVRAGDLNFDRVTDLSDWSLFYQAWTVVGMPALHLQAVLNPIVGDFDRSGVVNSSDYNLWKSSFGSNSELAADGNGSGTIDAADYSVWRDHLGDMIPPAFDNLVLTIDPSTGEGRITNYTVAPISLTGYSIVSTEGSLLPANGSWNSLQDQLMAGWQEASPTSFALSELTTSGALVLQPFASFELGQLFNASTAHDGVSLEFVVTTSSAAEIGDVTFAAIVGQGQGPSSSIDLKDSNIQSADAVATNVFATASTPHLNCDPLAETPPTQLVDWLRRFLSRRPQGAMRVGYRASAYELLLTDSNPHSQQVATRPSALDLAIDTAVEELANDDLRKMDFAESFQCVSDGHDLLSNSASVALRVAGG